MASPGHVAFRLADLWLENGFNSGGMLAGAVSAWCFRYGATYRDSTCRLVLYRCLRRFVLPAIPADFLVPDFDPLSTRNPLVLAEETDMSNIGQFVQVPEEFVEMVFCEVVLANGEHV